MKKEDLRFWFKELDLRQPFVWVATWGGCGLMIPAPGTWGTLGAIPVGLIFMILGGAPYLFIATLLLIPAGLWAAKKFRQATGEDDAGAVVIDEVAGMWIAMLPAGKSFVLIAAAFLLFRLFDVWKPWPICWLDSKLPGEWGVMADDILAGIYAAVGVILLVMYAGIA